jgi:thiamine-monophosphate kinase
MRSSLVRDVGEFGLIAALESALPEAARAGGTLDVGIGDDCAVWQPPQGSAVVVTTDSLVEGVHFRLEWTDWERLGHKTLAVNLSDIASMGAVPGIAVVTLALRGNERLADLEALYRGMGALAVSTGVRIAGGDIVASPTVLALHLTLLATAQDGTVLKRSGAKPGDLIAVSGTLGASAAGLRLLQAGGMNARRRAATADLLIEAHLRPQPRLALGRVLLEQGASACMDLSDGLFGDLPKLLTASGARGRLQEQEIPVAAAVRALFPGEWLQLATRGGEDYELLFTVSPEKWDAVKSAAEAAGSTLTAIGEVLPPDEEAPQIVMVSNGVERPVRSGAFDHFAG